jgi:hypothetical protein
MNIPPQPSTTPTATGIKAVRLSMYFSFDSAKVRVKYLKLMKHQVNISNLFKDFISQ